MSTTPITTKDQALAPIEQEQPPLATLPLFLIIEILQRLGNPRDILAFGATCKLYHPVSQDNHLWRSLFLREFHASIPRGTCLEAGACLTAYKCHSNIMKGRYATREIEDHTGYAWPLIQAGENLVGGFSDGRIKVWDTKNGVCKWTLEGHSSKILSLDWDDGNLISSSDDNTLKFWNLETGQCTQTDQFMLGPILACFDGHLITKPFDNTIIIVNLKTKEPRAIGWDEQRECRSLICIDNNLILVDDRGKMTIWDFKTCEKKKIIPEQTGVSSLLERNGNLIIGYCTGMIEFWDLKTGKCIKTLDGHHSAVNSIVWASGKLVSLDNVGTLIIWDLVSGRIMKYEERDLPFVLSVNGNLILNYRGGRIKIWDFSASNRVILAEIARLFRTNDSSEEAIQRFHYMPQEVRQAICNIYKIWNSTHQHVTVEEVFQDLQCGSNIFRAEAIEQYLNPPAGIIPWVTLAVSRLFRW